MDSVARNQIHEFLERDHEKYTSESIARGTGIPIAKVRAILAIETSPHKKYHGQISITVKVEHDNKVYSEESYYSELDPALPTIFH